MKHSDTVILYLDKKLNVTDSITMVLTWFSHKHAIDDGPTKASASLTLSDGQDSSDILLSVYSKHGESGIEIEYEKPLVWKGWRFELIGFDYNTSIEVVVSKI